jgi:hypothetical protein
MARASLLLNYLGSSLCHGLSLIINNLINKMPEGYKVNYKLLSLNTITTTSAASAAASFSIHLSTSCSSSLPLPPCFFLPLFLLLLYLLQ